MFHQSLKTFSTEGVQTFCSVIAIFVNFRVVKVMHYLKGVNEFRFLLLTFTLRLW